MHAWNVSYGKGHLPAWNVKRNFSSNLLPHLMQWKIFFSCVNACMKCMIWKRLFARLVTGKNWHLRENKCSLSGWNEVMVPVALWRKNFNEGSNGRSALYTLCMIPRSQCCKYTTLCPFSLMREKGKGVVCLQHWLLGIMHSVYNALLPLHTKKMPKRKPCF